ncbi:MAG: tetratricopeptide repeat protein [Planctomycetota bacterium]
MSRDQGARQDDGMDTVPEVMFLPLAVPEEDGFGDVDAGALARRIPDFVHQVLNQGQVGPTCVLEVQTPPEEGPVLWVVMDAPPDPDEAFSLLPPAADVRAVVTGEVLPVPDGFRVEFHVYFAEDGDERITSKVGGVLRRENPVPGMLQLTRRLARMLELPYHEPPRDILTANGRAFFLFLRALDNAMLLSGDLQIELPRDREGLLRPFSEALALDPRFGLALRVAHTTVALAVENDRLDPDAARRFLDACWSAQPFDGEGCVAVAEHLHELGDDQGAIKWLQHATHLDPPPSRGLETLGIMFARRGEMIAARDLWLRGLQLDGHPDFFGHLARLSFAEDRDLDAWDLFLRGLRRLRERLVRAAEWDDQDRGAGVLLLYLSEHLGERQPPPEVLDCLVDLRQQTEGDSQVYLGLCLMACDERPAAREELVLALRTDDLSHEAHDHAVRAMLNLDIADFERRFGQAADQALQHRRPRDCTAELQLFLSLQPTFWPARYYLAIARHRLGQADEALDLLEQARRIAPDRPEILHRMALLFDERGNPKRALELLDQALELRPDAAAWLGLRVQLLLRLGREDDARVTLQDALAIDAEDASLRKLRRQLGE